MEVEPRIGPAQYHDKEILMMNEQAIGSERRIEIIFVCFNPLLQMMCAQQFHVLFLLYSVPGVMEYWSAGVLI